MDALRRVHEALVPEGILLDLMPFAARIPVETPSERLGSLDAREFARTVRQVEAALADVERDGLFALEREVRFDVLEHFESAGTLLETVGAWQGTRIPAEVRAQIERHEPPFRVREQLVLRRLRAL